MLEKITLFFEFNEYIVVLKEGNKSYVYYFKYYTSAMEFIAGLLNTFSFAHYNLKIS